MLGDSVCNGWISSVILISKQNRLAARMLTLPIELEFDLGCHGAFKAFE
jgi:hypothetical protein